MIMINEYRILKFRISELQEGMAEVNAKIKADPTRKDLKSIRVKKLAQLKKMQQQRHAMMLELKSSPYSLIDLITMVEGLTDVQIAIARGGTEEGHQAIGALIDHLVTDAQRIMEVAA